jgi:hypothetical protein
VKSEKKKKKKRQRNAAEIHISFHRHLFIHKAPVLSYRTRTPHHQQTKAPYTSKARSSATTWGWSARGLKDTRTHTHTVPSLLGFTHRGTTADLRLDNVLLGPPSAPSLSSWSSALSSALPSRGAFFDKRVGERTMNSLGCPSEPNLKGRNNAPPPPLSVASSFPPSSSSFFPTLPAVALPVLPLPLLLPAGSSSSLVQKKPPHDSAAVAAEVLALEKAFAAASSV